MRRELRDMASAHGGNVVRLGADAQAGFSLRDSAGLPCLVAITDTHRKRIVDVAVPGTVAVPAAMFIELAEYIREAGIAVDGNESRCGLVRDVEGNLHSLFDLPERLELARPVHFHGDYEIRLPLILRSSSDFVLIGAEITRSPDVVEIDGDADFSECRNGCLPEGSAFGRNLVLSRSTFPAIPRRISVGRWLRISGTPIEVIPSSARIGGLDAVDSALRVIPPGMEIPGDVILSGSQVRRISGMRIGGSLYAERLPSFEVTEDCEIGGHVYADRNGSMSLPIGNRSRLFHRSPFGYERSEAR